MATNTLTDAKCRAAQPGPKAVKLFDGGGLFLWVSPKGAKIWRLAYRWHGKQQQISLGEYPLLRLAEARVRRDELRARIAAGEDPMAERRAQRGGMTLEEANNAYWDGRKDLSPSYVQKSKRAIETYFYPRFRDRPIGSLNRDDLMLVLQGVDAAGKHVYVRKMRLWVSQVFDMAVEAGEAQINPAALIDPRKAFGRAAVVNMAALPLAEIPELMQRLALEHELQSVLGCRLLALTWARTNELRKMRWSEVDGSLWRVPKERMKRRHDHLVPLSAQAIEVLKELRMRSRGSEFVFPSDRRLDRPMSENAILYLLHRIGYKGRMTGHGWRSVGSTWANENGHDKDAIERQLAHSPEDKVRAVYNRAEYLPQRAEMLQAWANWLDSCEVDAVGAQGGQAPPHSAAG